MSIFKISKSVHIPCDLTLNRKFYPWTALEEGHSFFVRGGKVTALSAKAAWAGRQYGKQYVCRTVKGGVRVWCLGAKDATVPRKKNQHNRVDPHPTSDRPSVESIDARADSNHDLTDGITGTLQKDKIERLEARLAEAMRVIEPFITAGDISHKNNCYFEEFLTDGAVEAARAFTNAAKEKT